MTEDVVNVSAPARLHLGFLDPGGRSGRRFGGIGLAVDAPSTCLSIRRAGHDRVEGADAERAEEHLAAMRRHLGLDQTYEMTIEETIPAHAGLGSGTQLALAVAAGVRALEGVPTDYAGDAARLGRGNRSGLGAAFFSQGGLAVDGGKGTQDRPPPIVSRFAFPKAWRVILVLDPSNVGLHGPDEIAAFDALPPFPERETAEICRLVLMQMLPGLAEKDIAAFGASIAIIQGMVSGHFAPAQGGVFTSPRVARACTFLADAGAQGIGQSSWGPTGFAFAESAQDAERLVEATRAEGAAQDLDIRIVAGRNQGASIERASRRELAGTG
ncbi:beta-ribofuranosylaminobenzene 5'-phosphate synthase family protein [Aurantimonas marina]|uniref:beta-ribofuranosylaminobenzene 5'-phosphate synthase family protein n=1 Tax=Aurantimonas marina TaxID=2780508 RepID=UPI0019D13A4B